VQSTRLADPFECLNSSLAQKTPRRQGVKEFAAVSTWLSYLDALPQLFVSTIHLLC